MIMKTLHGKNYGMWENVKVSHFLILEKFFALDLSRRRQLLNE